jgi:hypothetical protein
MRTILFSILSVWSLRDRPKAGFNKLYGKSPNWLKYWEKISLGIKNKTRVLKLFSPYF